MSSQKQLQNTLARLKKARDEMEAFSMETRDKNAQNLYQNGAKQLNQVINSVSGRSQYVNNQNQEQQQLHSDLDAE